MFGASCLLAIALTAGWGQERPYFVTYSHDLSQPGEMEVEGRTAFEEPENGNPFLAVATEVEYGVRNWWTTGLYLDGQSTDEESSILTGFSWTRLTAVSAAFATSGLAAAYILLGV
jgi:hypothetical protein